MRQIKINKTITNRDSNSLNIYLAEISKFPLISTEEEVILVRKIREGDQAALEKLVKSNLRFVVSIAKSYQNYRMTLNDLINAGNMGLIEAAKRFDETRGFKFICYSVWWIRQFIIRLIQENGRVIRLPNNQIHWITQINKVRDIFESLFERLPTNNEIADTLYLTVEKINEYINNSFFTYSLDVPIGEKDVITLLDILADENCDSTDCLVCDNTFASEVIMRLKILPVRTQQIINLYYGINGNQQTTLIEIAHILHLSKERVRQIKDDGIRKLRRYCNVKL
ncbi:sigma-70 family RNA polymerase sigma factor [Pedobacter frigoris]|uniref:Sigma-70 family RNA polymerase sigma factor n=1 Tax=Pedobacter frigoris TaxID=2571272 RepID=A0A4U1CCR9_9SPHI|nr:RNA polymerase sigma factor RpoD/SigA [Pedobacter frigoris]TKC03852.1 sigma-70 family RNA polymerase sigma factor [Pedobacter frigoris]